MTKSRIITCVAFALILASSAPGAEDKNGVSPDKISRPTGPGSLEGLGDSFQPALNTGMARYTVKFDLPEGVAGFTPVLTVRYDSGRGFGPVGIGWAFGPKCIRRQTEEGLPRYGDPPDGENIPDRFLGMDDEELVPLLNGCYLAKVEGLFLRYRRVGDHWEVHTKSGIKLEFGLTPEARVTDPTGSKVYCWHLQKQTDTQLNVIEYEYTMPDPVDRQIYLSEIRYGPGGGSWQHYYAAHMTYEDRPDPFTDYRSGFKVRTSKRLSQIDVQYDGALIRPIRSYVLEYGAHPHWSLLTTITQYDVDGVDGSSLPTTTFGYSTFDLGDPEVPISAANDVIGSSGEPSAVMDNSIVELIDLNGDGLPDLLSTDTIHLAYLNRGQHDVGGGQQAILWEGPIEIAAEEARTHNFSLSAENVHLADMTGDGISDLVVTDPFSVEYFENTGQLGWATGRLMSVQETPPPAPFGPEGESVKTSDLGFNKRIDVIQSQFGAYLNWFNQGDDRYTGPHVSEGVFWGEQFVDFADSGVHLEDMTGDRLNDVVKVTPISVIYWANKGYGRFDQAVEVPLPDRALDDSPGGNLHRAKLTDVNGDGLSDLVVERAQGTDLWFWLNLGDGTFEPSRVIVDLPVTPDATPYWADINGNGTTDLIYADSFLPESRINAVDLGELIGGSSHYNLLTSIDNGYGRRSTIYYRNTTDFYVDAHEAGNPWTTSVPFPTRVVSRVETTTGLNLDGFDGPDPDAIVEVPAGDDIYITDFVYRDGYYDPIEHQFRGFGFVKHIQHGDERFGGGDAPTLVTRHGFHTGAPDGIDNDGDGETDEPGDLWIGREEEPLKGVELWRETTTLPDDPLGDGQFADDEQVFERIQAKWEVRDLCDTSGGGLVDMLDADYQTDDDYARQVRQAVRTEERRSIIERGGGATKELKVYYDTDALGNQLFEWNCGDPGNPDDDLYTGYEYALNESAWIVDRVSRTFQTDSDAAGAFVSDVRYYYDGSSFEGLPLGQIGDRGNLHRVESYISGGTVPGLTERSFALGDPRDPNGWVYTLRNEFDDYGNPIVLRDPKGNDRIIEYDEELHKFPVSETIVIGGGSADLVVTASYDHAFGVPLIITDFNGEVSRFTYDTFGRFVQEFWPGDDPNAPTHTYTYDLGVPISSITTTAHANQGTSPDVTATVFFDGLGRNLGTYQPAGPVMSEVTLYNQRGQPWKVYQPYDGGDGTWSLPSDTVPAQTMAYDATGRAIETVTPPDANGITASIKRQYLPLQVKEYDAEDNNEGGPHHDTYKTLIHDGLGRLIEVHEIETLSDVHSGTFITRYRYTLPDRLAEIEDARGNVKYMRYDGLGRKIFMNDLDRGHVTYTYDAVGNLLRIVDAKGQEIVYTYDGANRLLTVDYLDDGRPLSPGRSPDIAYHYDTPSPDHNDLPHTAGQLAWVEDLTGAEFHGYDARGNLETVIKQVDMIGGTSQEWTTITRADSLGRVYETVYPDGFVVHQQYNARGLLQTIPDFLTEVTYHPSGQKASQKFANGVETSYAYDPRLRLHSLFTWLSTTVLQHLTYDFDQADNIVGITDDRNLPPGDPRNQTAAFIMDNLYRFQQADGVGYGTIEYDYDCLGNMALKTSDIPDPDVNIGDMVSGGSGGTAGRIGRDPNGPPGPHALTSTSNGEDERTFDYDDNGNMINNNGDGYVYDFADRLGMVVKDDRDIRYLYDYTGRRVIKRVDGVQTTYVSSLSEIRCDKLIKYIFAGGSRIARIEVVPPGPEPLHPPIQSDLPPQAWTPFPGELDPVPGVFHDDPFAAGFAANHPWFVTDPSYSDYAQDDILRIRRPPPHSQTRVFFYHTDHLGSTNVVTNAAGELVSESYNYPFGSLRHEYDPGAPFDPYYQFTGKEQDKESGLHYFEARFYLPAVGRFATTDPLLCEEPSIIAGMPQKNNLHTYVHNNPLSVIDPTGLDDEIDYLGPPFVGPRLPEGERLFRSVLRSIPTEEERKEMEEVRESAMWHAIIPIELREAFGAGFVWQLMKLEQLCVLGPFQSGPESGGGFVTAFGHTTESKIKGGASLSQAFQWLYEDLTESRRMAVQRLINLELTAWGELSPRQQQQLMEYNFNVGGGGKNLEKTKAYYRAVVSNDVAQQLMLLRGRTHQPREGGPREKLTGRIEQLIKFWRLE